MARLVVRVRPGARRTGFVGWFGDLPRLAVAARPAGGAANDEVVAHVASVLDVARTSVRIVGGATSRTKRLEVDDVDDTMLAERIRSVVPGGRTGSVT